MQIAFIGFPACLVKVGLRMNRAESTRVAPAPLKFQERAPSGLSCGRIPAYATGAPRS